MIDTNVLRQKIIGLAMSGKLTKQLPEDGTGEELYQKIQKDKQKRIKKGELKKGRKFDNKIKKVPFEIPSTWKWVHIGDVFQLTMGQSPKGEYVFEGNEGIEFHQGKIYFSKKYLQPSPQCTSKPTKIVEKNTVLLCVRAPVGTVNITTRRICIGRGLCGVNGMGGVSSEFIYFWLSGRKNDFQKKATGTTFIAITGKIAEEELIPLPPLAEQIRIVRKIEQFEQLINQLDDAQSRYTADTEIFEQKILDLAVQGKLVPQDPSDEPASVLLEKIAEEKKKLIKEGKIKKQKPLPTITEEDIPFEIPESWEWVHFSDLFCLSNGIASRGTVGGTKRPVLRLADLTSGQINTESMRDIALSEKEFNTHTISEGDLVFIRVNGSREKVANAFLYTGKQDISYCDHLFCGHKVSSLFDSVYIMYVYHSNMVRKQVSPEIKTTAGQNTINQKSMGKIIIPLPPLAEQKRIVARLDELHGILQI